MGSYGRAVWVPRRRNTGPAMRAMRDPVVKRTHRCPRCGFVLIGDQGVVRNIRGAGQLEDALEHGVLSAVTFTEVLGKLVGKGVPADQAEADLDELGLEVVDYDRELAKVAAHFYARRNPYNLSLGACAVLALGEHLGLPILTGEQAWAKLLGLRVKVRLIRKVMP
jgi:PIN domain nuclease of toxin-antitoxin system